MRGRRRHVDRPRSGGDRLVGAGTRGPAACARPASPVHTLYALSHGNGPQLCHLGPRTSITHRHLTPFVCVAPRGTRAETELAQLLQPRLAHGRPNEGPRQLQEACRISN